MDKYRDVVVSSRIRLARNADLIPFPKKLNDERAFSTVMKSAEESAKDCFPYKFYQMAHLSEIDRQAIFERHLISRELAVNTKNGAVIISDNEDIAVMINEEDHFRIQAINKGFNLQDAYNRAKQYDNALAGKIKLAFSEKLGYLTSCPTNLGTGMRASVMVFLPALTMSGKINGIINSIQQLSLTVRGVYGEGSKADGYTYQISNQVSLGQTEKEIIDNVTKVVDVVCEAELNERKILQSSEGIRLTDKIMRAYGTLTNACVLTTAELLECASLVRLGIAFNLLKFDGDMNGLIISCQPANLIKLAGKNLTADERDVFRAETVKNALKIGLGGRE